ncbi:MAG: hypothetical protein QOH36_2132 [Actinomycetota bacterium]|nr:hypothetical protein [Actinomycetota bacterium]
MFAELGPAFVEGHPVQKGSTVVRRRDDRGAAVVEFALVLPVLVLFVFGIIEFGRAYNARIELTSAVREGARASALGGDLAAATAATKAAAPGLTPSKIIVTASPATCPVNPLPTSNASVTATYAFQYSIPFLRSGTWTLTAKGVMRCGG